jgi:hypothetical protein
MREGGGELVADRVVDGAHHGVRREGHHGPAALCVALADLGAREAGLPLGPRLELEQHGEARVGRGVDLDLALGAVDAH